MSVTKLEEFGQAMYDDPRYFPESSHCSPSDRFHLPLTSPTTAYQCSYQPSRSGQVAAAVDVGRGHVSREATVRDVIRRSKFSALFAASCLALVCVLVSATAV